MASSSPFLALRWAFLSSKRSLIPWEASSFCSMRALNSLIFFSANWISSSWNSCSFTMELYSLLLRTFLSFSSYFLSNSLAVSMVCFCSVISCSSSFISALTLSSRVVSPAISFSKSSTSRGSSPLKFLISSIRESISCKSYRALNLVSTVASVFFGHN